MNDTISLREFIMSRIDSLEKLVDERFVQSEKALVLEARAMGAQLKSLDDKVESLKQSRDTTSGSNAVFVIGIPLVISATVFLVAHFLNI